MRLLPKNYRLNVVGCDCNIIYCICSCQTRGRRNGRFRKEFFSFWDLSWRRMPSFFRRFFDECAWPSSVKVLELSCFARYGNIREVAKVDMFCLLSNHLPLRASVHFSPILSLSWIFSIIKSKFLKDDYIKLLFGGWVCSLFCLFLKSSWI